MKSKKPMQYDLAVIYDSLVLKLRKVKKGLSFAEFQNEIKKIHKKPIPSNKLFWSNASIVKTLYKEAYAS